MKKLSGCGIVSVINEALHGTTARSRGQPNVRVWLSTTSSAKALTKRLCERHCHEVSWIETRSKFAVAVDRAVFL